MDLHFSFMPRAFLVSPFPRLAYGTFFKTLMLRLCVIDFKGHWDDHLPLIEFAYNNENHSSIQMDHYEALYGRRYRSPTGWLKVSEARLIALDLVHLAREKVKITQEGLKTEQSRQKSYMKKIKICNPSI